MVNCKTYGISKACRSLMSRLSTRHVIPCGVACRFCTACFGNVYLHVHASADTHCEKPDRRIYWMECKDFLLRPFYSHCALRKQWVLGDSTMQ